MITPRVTVPVEPTPGLTNEQIQSVMLEAIREVRATVTDHVEAASMDADIARMERGPVDMGATGWEVMRAVHRRLAMLSAAPAPEGGAVSVAARALLDACIADFGDPKNFPDDDGWVASGDKGDSAVTFKHMRDLQVALATREEAPAEAGEISDLEMRAFHAANAELSVSDYQCLVRDLWAAACNGTELTEDALTRLRAQPPARSQVSAEDARWLLENYGPTSPRIERIANAMLAQPPAREDEGGTLDPAFVAWLKERDCLPNDDDGTIEWADIVCALNDWEADLTQAREDALPVGWRSIDSAPKDGTVIDVWRADGGKDTVHWGKPHHDCGEAGGYCDSDWHSIRAPGWVCNTFDEFLGRNHNPFTHWKPLDEGPDAEPSPALTHPAPDALRVAVEALEKALRSHRASLYPSEFAYVRQALSALQAEQGAK